MSETIQDKIVVTRKEHQCFACRRPFPPGTEMRYWAGKYEGDFSSVYACRTCERIMDLVEPGDEGGYPADFVHEMLTLDQTPEQLLVEMEAERVAQ